jgi:hypothetical protein
LKIKYVFIFNKGEHMNKFKEGDKVILVESDAWSNYSGMREGGIYTVGFTGPTVVFVKGVPYAFGPDQFKLARSSNENKIIEREMAYDKARSRQ